jgi:hypothetical protein
MIVIDSTTNFENLSKLDIEMHYKCHVIYYKRVSNKKFSNKKFVIEGVLIYSLPKYHWRKSGGWFLCTNLFNGKEMEKENPFKCSWFLTDNKVDLGYLEVIYKIKVSLIVFPLYTSILY